MRLHPMLFGLILINSGCSNFQATNALSGSTSQSSQCSVKAMNQSNQQTAQVNDGDYHVKIFSDASEVHGLALYLNGQSSASTAARWQGASIAWTYNHAGAPSSFTENQVLATIQKGMDNWSSVCNIQWKYVGASSATSTPGSTNGVNVIGWGDSGGGSAGVTYNYSRKDSQGFSIFEADMIVSNTQVLDAQTLQGVLNHELGHYLGLAHSNVVESIMFANPYHPVPYLLILRQDDINGCSALYGAASSVVVTPPPTTTSPPQTSPPAPTTTTPPTTTPPTTTTTPASPQSPNSNSGSSPPPTSPGC